MGGVQVSSWLGALPLHPGSSRVSATPPPITWHFRTQQVFGTSVVPPPHFTEEPTRAWEPDLPSFSRRCWNEKLVPSLRGPPLKCPPSLSKPGSPRDSPPSSCMSLSSSCPSLSLSLLLQENGQQRLRSVEGTEAGSVPLVLFLPHRRAPGEPGQHDRGDQRPEIWRSRPQHQRATGGTFWGHHHPQQH